MKCPTPKHSRKSKTGIMLAMLSVLLLVTSTLHAQTIMVQVLCAPQPASVLLDEKLLASQAEVVEGLILNDLFDAGFIIGTYPSTVSMIVPDNKRELSSFSRFLIESERSGASYFLFTDLRYGDPLPDGLPVLLSADLGVYDLKTGILKRKFVDMSRKDIASIGKSLATAALSFL